MHGILHDVVAVIIGLPVFITGLESAAGNPGSETATVVVAPVIGLGELPMCVNRASKFSATNDQRLV